MQGAFAAAYANDEINSMGASELGSSKFDLVGERGTNPHEHFEAKYGKWRPFRLWKTINLVLILAITIGATICAVKSNDGLRWSSCWNIFRSFYYISEDWTRPDRIILISAILLALAFVTYAFHYIGKKKPGKSPKFMASIGITDICLTFLMASMLMPIFFSFTCRSIAEIRWFYPRLSNESMTLAELVEWKEDSRYYPYGGRYEYDDFGRRLTTTPSPVPTTPAPWIVRQQEERKYSIMLRLFMDPTIALSTFFAIFLNLVYAVRLLLLFKLTKVWSSDYRGMHPNCFKLGMAYANFWPFGLLKLVHWLVPLVSFYIFFYVNNYEVLPTHNITLAIVSIVWFIQWIFYLQKVRLHPGSMDAQQQLQQEQQHGLAQMVKKDLIYSGVALFIYFILSFIIFSSYRRSVEFIQIVLNISIFVHAASVLFTFLLLKLHGGPNAYSGFGLKIPGVTVNISINIQKNEDAPSANQQQNAIGNANVEKGGENVNAQKVVENI